MSTPITTFSHWDFKRPVSISDELHNRVTLNRIEGPQSLQLRHYTIYLILSGEGRYQAGFQKWNLGPGQYLIVNADQSLKIAPTSGEELAVLAVEVTPKTLREHFLSLLDPAELVTMQPFLGTEEAIELCQGAHQAQTGPLGERLPSMISHPVMPLDRFAEAEWIDILTRQLCMAQLEAYQQMLNLTSAKLSTKKELHRRLCQARAYMHNHLDEVLDLDTLSQVACLSKYHFIRLFKEAFGQTPRQYLIAQRLEQASSLLVHTQKTFHEICQEVGLKDSSSFGRLFKRTFGATPHLYRQMNAAS